ncbi:MAG: hypothetical protein HOM86_08680 [Gemmatimonadetes bacterium]|jgi:hypothetical protein|nr:hypothetical protein [Gemmatimonadota bacterium]
MTTEKQIIANQLNAQKSTGPRTPEGKERTRWNSLRHGLTATEPILSDEQLAGFAALQRELRDHYQPVGPIETGWVESLVSILWRLERIPRFEACILEENYHEERVRASRSGAMSEELEALQRTLVGPSTEKHQAAQATKEAARSTQPISAIGFMVDARGKNVLEKLTRYERDLFNKMFRLTKELDARKDQGVEGEILA